MRITNKIMQNNSLYNINNNKVMEDKLNTQTSTGKKINRPSDDPVIAIRALRLRSNVAQLNQYYEKNVKDARSFLEVSGDALDTTTAVLTDLVKQATKGANKDLTLDDLDTIITQMEALSDEFYSTGNSDFAGRYVFTGFRTDTPLSFDKTTSKNYKNIEDTFNSTNIDTSFRMVGSSTEGAGQEEIKDMSVSRLRLSYETLNYKEGDGKTASISFKEAMTQPATSTVIEKENVIKLNFKTEMGEKSVFIPTSMGDETYNVVSEGYSYEISKNASGNFIINGSSDNGNIKIETDEKGHLINTSGILAAETSLESVQKTSVTYTDQSGKKEVKVPMLFNIGQTMEINIGFKGDSFKATVNSDGTIRLEDNLGTDGDILKKSVVNLSTNGSVYNSYVENTIEIKNILYSTSSDMDIDNAYKNLNNGNENIYLNAGSGEILLSEKYSKIFSNLKDITNTDTISVIYDKNEWKKGDIVPENLFSCELENSDRTILYNKGIAPKDLLIDVGFNQNVKINTTADEIFTSNVGRDVEDLKSKLSNLKTVADKIKVLKENGEDTEAMQKTYDFLRDDIQKEFEKKITSMQNTLNKANIAVTDNGTRSKRLDMIEERLANQTLTFKELQSDNEDIDLAETVTQLTSAQLAYEASLMATGKISQSSLINFI